MELNCELMALRPDAVHPLVAKLSGASSDVEPVEAPQPYLMQENGATIAGDAVAAAVSGGSKNAYLAVVPVMGVLSPSGDYGGTSLSALASNLKAMDANESVHSILLHVRSPGGTVVGTPEAADAVRAVRANGTTRIATFADGMMASAATWIGTAAGEVTVSRSGEAGSIGVIAMYADYSQMLEEAGIKVTVTRTPDLKARFSGYEPMSEEMQTHMDHLVERDYQKFLRAMADNRNVRIDQVEKRFGGGEMMDSSEAVEAGLVDAAGDFDTVLAKYSKPQRRRAPRAAHARLALARMG